MQVTLVHNALVLVDLGHVEASFRSWRLGAGAELAGVSWIRRRHHLQELRRTPALASLMRTHLHSGAGDLGCGRTREGQCQDHHLKIPHASDLDPGEGWDRGVRRGAHI